MTSWVKVFSLSSMRWLMKGPNEDHTLQWSIIVLLNKKENVVFFSNQQPCKQQFFYNDLWSNREYIQDQDLSLNSIILIP